MCCIPSWRTHRSASIVAKNKTASFVGHVPKVVIYPYNWLVGVYIFFRSFLGIWIRLQTLSEIWVLIKKNVYPSYWCWNMKYGYWEYILFFLCLLPSYCVWIWFHAEDWLGFILLISPLDIFLYIVKEIVLGEMLIIVA